MKRLMMSILLMLCAFTLTSASLETTNEVGFTDIVFISASLVLVIGAFIVAGISIVRFRKNESNFMKPLHFAPMILILFLLAPLFTFAQDTGTDSNTIDTIVTVLGIVATILSAIFGVNLNNYANKLNHFRKNADAIIEEAVEYLQEGGASKEDVRKVRNKWKNLIN